MSDSGRYIGAADPADGANEFNAFDFAVQRIINKRVMVRLVKIQAVTNQPGQLTKVGTVDVLPMVNQLDGAGNAMPHTTVSKLSYHRHQGGKNAVIIDPEVGDIGLAVFADNDGSVVQSTMSQSNPGSRRRSAFEDGIYIGLSLGGATIDQYVTFTSGGIGVKDKNNNTMSFTSSGLFISAPNGMFVNGATITNGGNVIAANGVDLEHHLHSDAGGSGDSGPPIP